MNIWNSVQVQAEKSCVQRMEVKCSKTDWSRTPSLVQVIMYCLNREMFFHLNSILSTVLQNIFYALCKNVIPLKINNCFCMAFVVLQTCKIQNVWNHKIVFYSLNSYCFICLYANSPFKSKTKIYRILFAFEWFSGRAHFKPLPPPTLISKTQSCPFHSDKTPGSCGGNDDNAVREVSVSVYVRDPGQHGGRLQFPKSTSCVNGTFSGVLTQVTAASRAVGAALEPVHNVFQVSTMAAPLTPHKQSLHHMVAHCTYTGTLVAPSGETQGDCQRSVHIRVYYSV